MNKLNILENTEEFKKLLNVQFLASQKSYYDLFNEAILNIEESNKKLTNKKKVPEFFNKLLENAPKVSEKLKTNLNALFESLKNNEHVKKIMVTPDSRSYGAYYLIVELNDIYHEDNHSTNIFKNIHVVFYLNFSEIEFFTFSKSLQSSLHSFIDHISNCVKDDFMTNKIESLPIDGFLLEKIGFGGVSDSGPSFHCSAYNLNETINSFNKAIKNENDIDKSSAVNFVNYILNLILTNPKLFNEYLYVHSCSKMAIEISNLDEILSDYTTSELFKIYRDGYYIVIPHEDEE